MDTDREYVILEPNGRVVIPPSVMEKYVLFTPGCALWFNRNDLALGLRLLRNVDDPPYRIERRPLPDGGEEGVLEAGGFLAKAGMRLPEKSMECDVSWFEKYRVLAVMLGKEFDIPEHESKGFLDTIPPLED